MFIIHNRKNIITFLFIMHNMSLTVQIPKYLNLKRNEPAEVQQIFDIIVFVDREDALTERMLISV